MATQMTVTGKTLTKISPAAAILDPEVIRPLENPYSAKGGLSILFGNLAPLGAVIKTGAVAAALWRHPGPARVFDSEKRLPSGHPRRANSAGRCGRHPL